ncbi:MAG: isoprenylcysteine carboxylmethyltransferase family protein [Anaerolineae bacterium]|nr:isoprenylcysteine carboxylmethyltransferase family protein [Anaerolineae bacterium]
MSFFDIFQLAGLLVFLGIVVGRTISVQRKTRRIPIRLSIRRNNVHHVFALILFGCVNLWVAGILRTVLFSGRMPVPDFLDYVLIDSFVASIIGISVITCGFVVFILGLRQLGTSWRLGIDEQAPGALITGGIYAVSRNPIYVFFALYFLGTFLINGTVLFLLFLVIVAANLHYQVLQEEAFLAQAFGPAYAAYASRTGRYVTLSLRASGVASHGVEPPLT